MLSGKLHSKLIDAFLLQSLVLVAFLYVIRKLCFAVVAWPVFDMVFHVLNTVVVSLKKKPTPPLSWSRSKNEILSSFFVLSVKITIRNWFLVFQRNVWQYSYSKARRSQKNSCQYDRRTLENDDITTNASSVTASSLLLLYFEFKRD